MPLGQDKIALDPLDLLYRHIVKQLRLKAQGNDYIIAKGTVVDGFSYTDGTTEGTTPLRIHDREWRIDLDAMHYKFELKVWVEQPETFTPMETMDYTPEVTNGEN